jgi:hypothetical protein
VWLDIAVLRNARALVPGERREGTLDPGSYTCDLTNLHAAWLRVRLTWADPIAGGRRDIDNLLALARDEAGQWCFRVGGALVARLCLRAGSSRFRAEARGRRAEPEREKGVVGERNPRPKRGPARPARPQIFLHLDELLDQRVLEPGKVRYGVENLWHSGTGEVVRDLHYVAHMSDAANAWLQLLFVGRSQNGELVPGRQRLPLVRTEDGQWWFALNGERHVSLVLRP